MSELQNRFEQAQTDVKALPERPGNLTLLRLYALYKQATEGDASGPKPGMTDFIGKYKFEAWTALNGTSSEAAMNGYVELVEELKRGSAK